MQVICGASVSFIVHWTVQDHERAAENSCMLQHAESERHRQIVNAASQKKLAETARLRSLADSVQRGEIELVVASVISVHHPLPAPQPHPQLPGNSMILLSPSGCR